MKVHKRKSALKSQREGLSRFRHFLPVLELKKQLLRNEVQAVDYNLEGKEREERETYERLRPWVRLLAEDVDLPGYLELQDVVTETGNIAGVDIPLLRDAIIARKPVDFFSTPTWVEDALDAITVLIRLRVEQRVLLEQRRRLSEELRVTSQRVNLLDKVKIPECEANIRIIQIALGDAQTAAVARAKTAKAKGRATVGAMSEVSAE